MDILFDIIDLFLLYIDNGVNVRMISLPNCIKGRVEFYNGTTFGTLTDCNEDSKWNMQNQYVIV